MRNITATHALVGFVALPIDVIGTIGNTALLLVLLRRPGEKPMYIILKWMSATNIVLLMLNLAFQSLPTIWHVARVMNPWYRFAALNATYLTPIATAAHFIKVWLTVLLSVERWSAVCRPLKFRSTFTVKRVRIMVFVIVLCAIAYHLPRYFEEGCATIISKSGDWNGNGVVNSSRRVPCELHSAVAQSPIYRYGYGVIVYSLFVFALPVGAALTLNTFVIYEIRRGESTLADLSIVQKYERRISKVPLAMAVVFCILQTPAMLVNIFHFAVYSDPAAQHNTSLWNALLGMTAVLILTDSAADFIVYFYNINCSVRSFVKNLCGRRNSPQCPRQQAPKSATCSTKTSSEVRLSEVTTKRWVLAQSNSYQHFTVHTNETVNVRNFNYSMI